MKKGAVFFTTLITFAAIGVVLMLLVSLSNRESVMKGATLAPFKLAQLYDQTTGKLFYIDEAATYSAYQALHEWTSYGGFDSVDSNPCGNYSGDVIVWYDGNKCYPTTEQMKESFKILFLPVFEKYLIENSLRFNLSKLLFSVGSVGGKTEVKGLADVRLSSEWLNPGDNLGEQYFSPSFKTYVDFDFKDVGRVITNAKQLPVMPEVTEEAVTTKIQGFNTENLTWHLESYSDSVVVIKVVSSKKLPYFDGSAVDSKPVVFRFALLLGAVERPAEPIPEPTPVQTECEQQFPGAMCTNTCIDPGARLLGQGPGASHGCYEADENKPICCSTECEMDGRGVCRNVCEDGEGYDKTEDYGCLDRNPAINHCCEILQS